MAMPQRPKIYHILHLDKLSSVVNEGLLSDEQISVRANAGTMIGMSSIKHRRLHELTLTSHPGLHVGQCVPFYFCPRSVMLYLIHMRNDQLMYSGGQEPILHLECDLYNVTSWADANRKRWAFTLSNAGSRYFEDRCRLAELDQLDWAAIQSNQWGGPTGNKEAKQAEFLVEGAFPWSLVERIGVCSQLAYQKIAHAIPAGCHRPPIEVKSEWYY